VADIEREKPTNFWLCCKLLPGSVHMLRRLVGEINQAMFGKSGYRININHMVSIGWR